MLYVIYCVVAVVDFQCNISRNFYIFQKYFLLLNFRNLYQKNLFNFNHVTTDTNTKFVNMHVTLRDRQMTNCKWLQ